jgi:hypothetical protein
MYGASIGENLRGTCTPTLHATTTTTTSSSKTKRKGGQHIEMQSRQSRRHRWRRRWVLLLLLLSLHHPSSVRALSSPVEISRGGGALKPPPPPFRIYYDSSNYLHRDAMQYHSEQPERITVCVRALDAMQTKRAQDLSSGALRSNTIHGRMPNNAGIQLVDVASEATILLPSSSFSTTAAIDEPMVHHNRPFSAQELDYARQVLLRTHNPAIVTGLDELCRTSSAKDHQPADAAGEQQQPGTTSMPQQQQQRRRLGRHIGYVDSGGDTYVTTETTCASGPWRRGSGP